jgi:hypothetical protein
MHTSILRATLVITAATGAATGQTIEEGIGPGPRVNSSWIRPQAVKSADPKVVVFIGDRVIPQFVDGGSCV